MRLGCIVATALLAPLLTSCGGSDPLTLQQACERLLSAPEAPLPRIADYVQNGPNPDHPARSRRAVQKAIESIGDLAERVPATVRADAKIVAKESQHMLDATSGAEKPAKSDALTEASVRITMTCVDPPPDDADQEPQNT